MNYRKRASHYLFTVKYMGKGTASQSENFFKELCRVNRALGKGQLFRMGRLRNRSGMTNRAQAVRGHVPIEVSDRWDVYVRVPYDGHPFNTDALHSNRARQLIHNARDLIWDNQQLIEYCNEAHKDLFEKIFVVNLPPLPKEIVSVPDTNKNKVVAQRYTNKEDGTILIPPFHVIQKTNRENMKTNTTWDVTITAQISTNGETAAEVQNYVRAIPGLKNVVVVKFEKVDLHKDLPLVQFTYRNDSIERDRELRVTLMDAIYLEGFEGESFKRFLRSKIVAGAIILVEMPSKPA